MSHPLRAPCPRCGGAEGRIETRNGQDCVFCVGCLRHQYNAPKTETGRAPRTVQTTHEGITPKKRARVLLRATGRCELCGNKGNLHVGHLLSVDDGLRAGLTDFEVNDEENLSAMCDECNLGLGKECVPIRLVVAILCARIRNANPGSES